MSCVHHDLYSYMYASDILYNNINVGKFKIVCMRENVINAIMITIIMIIHTHVIIVMFMFFVLCSLTVMFLFSQLLFLISCHIIDKNIIYMYP